MSPVVQENREGGDHSDPHRQLDGTERRTDHVRLAHTEAVLVAIVEAIGDITGTDHNLPSIVITTTAAVMIETAMTAIHSAQDIAIPTIVTTGTVTITTPVAKDVIDDIEDIARQVLHQIAAAAAVAVVAAAAVKMSNVLDIVQGGDAIHHHRADDCIHICQHKPCHHFHR